MHYTDSIQGVRLGGWGSWIPSVPICFAFTAWPWNTIYVYWSVNLLCWRSHRIGNQREVGDVECLNGHCHIGNVCYGGLGTVSPVEGIGWGKECVAIPKKAN
jgi:hypothetical protein